MSPNKHTFIKLLLQATVLRTLGGVVANRDRRVVYKYCTRFVLKVQALDGVRNLMMLALLGVLQDREKVPN